LTAPRSSRGSPSAAERRLVERLRRLCLDHPEATEKASHGEPTWFAGRGKVFATLDNHHHGAEHLSVWLPLPLGAQEALLARDPARYFRPPYVGARGWVGVVLDEQTDWAMVAGLVREAYLKVASRKLAAALVSRAR
jgi:predicted DNA-binding protein (MmcQ/YjbR family)